MARPSHFSSEPCQGSSASLARITHRHSPPLPVWALFMKSQGRFADAEPLFKRALEGFQRVRGADDLQALIGAGNLGSLYRVQGRYAEAEPLYKSALAGI